MSLNVKNSFKTALKSSWIILKLIVPIYIFADILFYYNLLSHVTFIFSPIVTLLELPPEAALSIVSGLFLNLYAAIAFAVPLGLGAKEWTTLAIFLGIAHALLVETEIMKHLGISRSYSITLRLITAMIVGGLVAKLPQSWFEPVSELQSSIPEHIQYKSLFSLLYHSICNALYLAFEIIILVTLLIFILDFIKSLRWIQNHSEKINSSFSIMVGVILGITYGAGILIAEYKKGILKRKEIVFIGSYLMICHAIIEDTLLFVLFGANGWLIVSMRLFFATLIATLVVRYIKV